MACVAEDSHDEQGLIWPISVAPYAVHLVVLLSKDGREVDPAQNPSSIADKIYADLTNSGIEVLYDDRNESPGVKFNDADLIGIPLRLTVSGRALKAGGIELKRRHDPSREIVELPSLIEKIHAEIEALENAIQSQLKPIPFKG